MKSRSLDQKNGALKTILPWLLVLYTIPLFSSAITYNFTGGRFGDNVITYCKAKYCSQHNNIPLLYKPFPGSEHLALHLLELKLSQTTPFLNHIAITSCDEVDPERPETLYLTNLYTPLIGMQPPLPEHEAIPIPYWMNFWPDEIYTMMQTDTSYHDAIKKMLTIVHETPSLTIPADTISVAIHLRKGGNWDPPLSSPQWYDSKRIEHFYPSTINPLDFDQKNICYPEQCNAEQINLYTSSLAAWQIQIENVACYELKPFDLYKSSNSNPRASDKKFPLRFPPEQFYGDQLNLLATTLADHKLSVILFTDDTNPHALLNRMKQYCTAPTIHFLGILSSKHFTDDLALMAQVDCLIRPCSHFSGTAQLIGNHKIILSPKNHAWKGSILTITETNIVIAAQTVTAHTIVHNTLPDGLKEIISALFDSSSEQKKGAE